MNNPPQGSQAKARPNGDILLYDPKTNTFGAYDKFGTPKSMFRPTAGIAYFLAQAGKVIAPLVIILSPTPVE